MIRRPPRSTLSSSSAASDVYKRQAFVKGSAWFWPKIGDALIAKHPWLVIACDSCGTVVDFDLRVKPRDHDASIRVTLRDVRCPRCNGDGRPRIVALARHPSI